MCRVPESRTGGHRRTAIPRVHPGADVQASRPGTGDVSECCAADSAFLARYASNSPCEAGDSPLADGDGQSTLEAVATAALVAAGAAGAAAALLTAGGAGAAYRSEVSEGRSRQ